MGCIFCGYTAASLFWRLGSIITLTRRTRKSTKCQGLRLKTSMVIFSGTRPCTYPFPSELRGVTRGSPRQCNSKVPSLASLQPGAIVPKQGLWWLLLPFLHSPFPPPPLPPFLTLRSPLPSYPQSILGWAESRFFTLSVPYVLSFTYVVAYCMNHPVVHLFIICHWMITILSCRHLRTLSVLFILILRNCPK